MTELTKVFISHNKEQARILAIALVEQGIGVWFDEWDIRPGDSITGGIENGLSNSDVFVLIWSVDAQKSNWVGTELRAILRRRVDDKTLRIVPLMLDDIPLPTLVADYRGFAIQNDDDLFKVASEIVGNPSERIIARLLQNRLLELTGSMTGHTFVGGDLLPYHVCPECGSPNLKRF